MNETPYSIKRDGLTLTNCESEPVQTPGCIQTHGALLVLRLTDLTVLQASENTEKLLGKSPESLLGQPIERVVGEANAVRLRALLDQPSSEHNAQYAFQHQQLDASAHQIGGVGVLEFEAAEHEETSQDYLAQVKSAVGRLQSASGLQTFCQRVAEEVQELTGLDRVMVYRFHEDNHGEVFAESKREALPPGLGSTIPRRIFPSRYARSSKKSEFAPSPMPQRLLLSWCPWQIPTRASR